MKMTRWFKVNKESREFLYLHGSQTKDELKPFIEFVEKQGDIYRITRQWGRYFIWDARI